MGVGCECTPKRSLGWGYTHHRRWEAQHEYIYAPDDSANDHYANGTSFMSPEREHELGKNGHRFLNLIQLKLRHIVFLQMLEILEVVLQHFLKLWVESMHHFIRLEPPVFNV